MYVIKYIPVYLLYSYNLNIFFFIYSYNLNIVFYTFSVASFRR